MEKIPRETDTRTLKEHFVSIGKEDWLIISEYLRLKHTHLEYFRKNPSHLYSFKVPGYDGIIFHELNYALGTWCEYYCKFPENDFRGHCLYMMKAVSLDVKQRLFYCFVAVAEDSSLIRSCFRDVDTSKYTKDLRFVVREDW